MKAQPPAEKDGAVELTIYVQPRARKTELSGTHNGVVKLKVAAPPVEDAANEAIVEFFASKLHVSKSSIKIITGAKSRLKRLRFERLTLQQLRVLLP